MNPDELNALSGAVTQTEILLKGLRVALAVATSGYQSDQDAIAVVQTKLDTANVALGEAGIDPIT